MVELIARNHGALVTKYGGSQKTVVAQLLWGLLSLRHGAFFAWFRGYRQSAGAEPVKLGENERAQLRAALGRQELELGALQKATLSDTYWKLYFLLS